MEGSEPPSNTWFLGPIQVLNPNGISIGSAIFAQLMADRPHTLHLQWATFPLSKLPLPMGNQGPSNTIFLSASEPTSQTASQLVHPCLHRSLQSVPILYNGRHLLPSKLLLPMGNLNPHVIHGSLGQLESSTKRHLHQFSHFCQAHYRDRLTDATRSITTGCIYEHSTIMRPHNTIQRHISIII